MEHILQSTKNRYSQYIKSYNKLFEELASFEDRHELPIGINITAHEKLIYEGIIQVTVRPSRKLIEAKYYYDTNIHPYLEEELDLKLIKVEKTTTYHNKGANKKYIYHYTYTGNQLFEKIELGDIVM